MANCKSCRRSVRWVVLVPSGSRTPLDSEPTPTGNVRLIGDGGWDQHATVLCKFDADAARERGEQLYTSHFATCPDAPAFRKRGARG